MNKNDNLHIAKGRKDDEYYTELEDINREINFYKKHFENKIVYCNCDDPTESKFFYHFSYDFEFLKLKKLITTCYKNCKRNLFSQNDCKNGIKLEYNGDKNGNFIPDPEEIKDSLLNGDGDFRSKECIEILKQADIVVTNPPFSLFRKYISQLINYNKKFIIIGNLNAISYKEIFSLIKENKIWLGINPIKRFLRPDGTFKKFGNTVWYTNLEHYKKNEKLYLTENYKGNEENYPKYDNYNAINVDKVKDIPKDYKDYMGVPITFLNKYNPNQFEILALGITGSINFNSNKKMEILDKNGISTNKYTFNAKGTLYRKYNPKLDKNPSFKNCLTGELYSSIYARIIIKRK